MRLPREATIKPAHRRVTVADALAGHGHADHRLRRRAIERTPVDAVAHAANAAPAAGSHTEVGGDDDILVDVPQDRPVRRRLRKTGCTPAAGFRTETSAPLRPSTVLGFTRTYGGDVGK